MQDYPADIEQLLDHLGVGRFYLFAISGGCPSSWVFAPTAVVALWNAWLFALDDLRRSI
jgi:pimeloyl-ACP methyl ester carboxylesterase